MRTCDDNRGRRAPALALFAALGLLAAGCADLTYDATPPTVSVVYPAAWASLGRDTIDIRADAYDNHGLDRVVFYVDGESLAAVRSEPYHARWYPDTTGCHSVYCVAHDAAGNETHTSPIFVTIIAPPETPPDREPPVVSLVRPASWSVVSDTVRVEALAWDNRGVTELIFFLDGDTLALLSNPPWIHYWDSRAAGNGTHTLYAAASDSSGNRAHSAVITVDVRNGP
ncbi:MAG: Ig-like domain-containing protein [bacterium]